MSRSPKVPKTADITYDVAKERLATQLSTADALDTKVSMILGFGSASLALMGTFLALSDEKAALSHITIALIVLSAGIYALLFILSLVVLWPRTYAVGTSLSALWDRANEETTEQLRSEVAESFKTAFEENAATVKCKGRLTFAIIVLLVCQSIAAASAFLADFLLT